MFASSTKFSSQNQEKIIWYNLVTLSVLSNFLPTYASNFNPIRNCSKIVVHSCENFSFFWVTQMEYRENRVGLSGHMNCFKKSWAYSVNDSIIYDLGIRELWLKAALWELRWTTSLQCSYSCWILFSARHGRNVPIDIWQTPYYFELHFLRVRYKKY